MTLRVLCLDTGDGLGGATRSLLESIRHIDRRRVAPEVWCRTARAAVKQYEALGVTCRIVPFPRFSALPRLSRNLYTLGQAKLAQFGMRESFRELVCEATARFDVVHANQESLSLLTSALRRRVNVPIVMHMRTVAVPTAFARWQARSISRSVDQVVFITENEREAWEGLGLRVPESRVIYNIAVPLPRSIVPHPAVPDGPRLRVGCFSNYAWIRGVDRLVDVATELKSQGRMDVHFVMAGEMRLRGSLPGLLGRIAARGGTLADFAASMGVDDMFTFLGHVSEPERVLAACDVVARPSRGNNPWGRESLEALAAGIPVVCTGTYQRFVEDGVTGMVQSDYDRAAFAGAIVRLADDPALRRRLGETGRRRIANLCNGRARAEDLHHVWAEVSARRTADVGTAKNAAL